MHRGRCDSESAPLVRGGDDLPKRGVVIESVYEDAEDVSLAKVKRAASYMASCMRLV